MFISSMYIYQYSILMVPILDHTLLIIISDDPCSSMIHKNEDEELEDRKESKQEDEDQQHRKALRLSRKNKQKINEYR